MEKIEKLDKLDCDSSLGEEGRIEHMKLISQFKLLANKELSILAQKARCHWLGQGIPIPDFSTMV